MVKKVVVKIGSSIIAPKGKLDVDLLSGIVDDIFKAEKKGYEVIIVSSGAIASGLNELNYKKRPHDIHSLMALSSLGQIILMDAYIDKFKKHNKLCAQILLTWDDFDVRKRFINVRCTMEKLFTMGVIPIINENDAVSYDEIRFGDNDRLSALVSDLIGAELLIILSDVEGLMDKDKLVKEVSKIDEKILSLVKKEDKVHTAGGMDTKLEATRIATSSGIKTIIANGRVKGVISSVLNGEKIGTVFLPAQKVASARKRWIAFGKKVKGKVYIDDGAKEAVICRGKSLLGVGIIRIEGEFKSKDAVQILDKEGSVLGCGIVDYSSSELKDLKAKKFEKEIVHRDNLVLDT